MRLRFASIVAVSISMLGAIALAADDSKVTLERWLAMLASTDLNGRREAVYQLGKLGAGAKLALPALINAVDDNDKQVWSGALSVIAILGPEAAEAVPKLIESFDAPNGKARERDRQQAQLRIAFSLSKIGAPAIPALITALGNDSNNKRAGAAKALAGIGPAAADAVPALVKNIGSGDEMVRRETVDALGQIGAPAVKPLIEALGSTTELTRRSAVSALGQIGNAAAEAIPAVAGLIYKEKSAPVLADAYTALPRLGPPTDETVQLIIGGALNPDDAVRHGALNGLLGSNAYVAKSIALLTEGLRKPDAATAQNAAKVMGRIGSRASSAVPALIERARKSPQDSAFTDALAQIGPPAIQPLVDQLGSGKAADREWIFRALRGMGSPAIAPLTSALKAPSATVRAGAASALADMTFDSDATERALFILADDKDSAARAAGLRAISFLRGNQEEASPKLEAALADPNPLIHKTAAAGLARIGKASKVGVGGLLDLMNEPDIATQRTAIQAIAALGKAGYEAIPIIIQRLEVPDLQIASLETLAKFGEASKDAIPRATQFVTDGPDEIRLAAIQTLSAIGTDAAPALPALYKSLEVGNREITIQAIKALVRIEPSDEKLKPVIMKVFMKSTGGGLRSAAAIALKRFGDDAQEAVPTLLDMLVRENERSAALGVLNNMKVRAVPQLIAKLNDKAPAVQKFACEALGKLGPEAKDAVPALQKVVDESGPSKGVAKKAIEQINAAPKG